MCSVMRLIKRDTDYAIRALRYIAESEDGIVSVSRLASILQLPRPFLRKILQRLNKTGLVMSFKGKGGGFRLARSPKEIAIGELIETFQGSFKIYECFIGKSPCRELKSCILKKRLRNIERELFAELRSISLASLIKQKNQLWLKEK